MVMHLMGVAADDLKRTKAAELGVVDLDVSRCYSGGGRLCFCRRPQHDHPDSR